jgi:restriction system protein
MTLEAEWQQALVNHEIMTRQIEEKWRLELAQHKEDLAHAEAEYVASIREWEASKTAYEEQLAVANSSVDDLQSAYLASEPEAIEEYCELVIKQGWATEPFGCDARFAFQADNGVLVVDYDLISQDDLPKLKEVKYVQARDEFVETQLSERELAKLYDDLLFQIALRTVHELYTADVSDEIRSIVFNGWVTSVDRATGKEVTACIMSFQAVREAFMEITLEEVDPKACFRSLKGISAAQLHSLTPVAPVLAIDKDDPRFVSSYEVAAALTEGDNLAAMDWEDFEHLIREVFEQEFSVNGGEVKVTQASRDGGVDAIAFDPDPIRGGKIVIQAKRYTNVVGVSAVRDLYGTVINEGATKGILITTANYGADAHQFAQGKPLVLLSGNHLLHLLEKHGHKARIDLKEAKQVLADREKNQTQ